MANPALSSRFTVGDWTVEPDIGQISRNGEAAILEPRVMDLLVCLAEHAGETVSTDQLAEIVWAGRAITDQPVYQGVAQLRKALDDEARHPRYLATVTKKGYRLIAPVGVVEPDVALPMVVDRPDRRPRSFFPVLSLILAGSYLFLSSSDVSVSRERDVQLQSDFGSIAVLPFVDMSEDRSQQYLGDGIAEELIHRIAAAPDMRVVARTSSFSFRDSGADVQTIGQQLGADVILEGSVRKSGDRLRVTAQLVSAADGYHIWSHTYEPISDDAFGVQDQIAAGVVQQLRLGPDTGGPPSRSWTHSTAAAEGYYLGMFHMHKRRPASLDKALDYLQQAVAHDPQFALGYAGLAKAYFLASDARYGNIPDAEAMEKSRAATDIAQSLDDRLPEVLERLAGSAWDSGNLEEAEALMLRAIRINPNFASIYHVYGHYLAESGRYGEMLAAYQKAVALDPLSPTLRINLANALAHHNRMADAEVEILKAIELDPTSRAPYFKLGGLMLSTGEYARAIELGIKAFSMEGPQTRWSGEAAMLVAYSFLSLEDFASADQWYQSAEELNVGTWRLANERLHWLLAQDRFSEADGLLSHWENRQPNIENVYRFGGLYRAILGQDAAATAMLERAAEMGGGMASLYEYSNWDWGYMPAVHLVRLYKLSGSDDQANALLDKAEKHVRQFENKSPGVPGAHYVRASIHALRGNDRDAMKSLRHALSAGWTRRWFVERDPIFAAYHGNEELHSILDQMQAHIDSERQALAQLADATP